MLLALVMYLSRQASAGVAYLHVDNLCNCYNYSYNYNYNGTVWFGLLFAVLPLVTLKHHADTMRYC